MKILVIKLSGEVLLEISVVDHTLLLVFAVQGVLLQHSRVEGVHLPDLPLAHCLHSHHSRLLRRLWVDIDLCLSASQPDVQAAATAEVSEQRLPNFGLLDQHEHEG